MAAGFGNLRFAVGQDDIVRHAATAVAAVFATAVRTVARIDDQRPAVVKEDERACLDTAVAEVGGKHRLRHRITRVNKEVACPAIKRIEVNQGIPELFGIALITGRNRNRNNSTGAGQKEYKNLVSSQS